MAGRRILGRLRNNKESGRSKGEIIRKRGMKVKGESTNNFDHKFSFANYFPKSNGQ